MEVLSTPSMTCEKCHCKFRYDKTDVHVGFEQVWTGFSNEKDYEDSGWKYRDYRYLICPGCAIKIKL